MQLTKKGEKWRKTFNSTRDQKPNVLCDNCGYQNKYYWVQISGVCNGCGKVLDEKAKFKADMNNKLHLWRNKRWK